MLRSIHLEAHILLVDNIVVDSCCSCNRIGKVPVSMDNSKTTIVVVDYKVVNKNRLMVVVVLLD